MDNLSWLYEDILPIRSEETRMTVMVRQGAALSMSIRNSMVQTQNWHIYVHTQNTA